MTWTPDTTRTTFVAAPAFVVRIAGMPMDVLHGLRFDRTMRLVDAILDIEEWLGQMAEPLSNELYGLIGGLEDQQLRRRLISLRRDAYRGRLPRGGRPDELLLSAMPGEIAAKIEGWYAQVERRAALEAEAGAVLAAEMAEKRRALRDAASDRAFQHAIVLASRDLYPDLAAWLDAAGEPREDRKLELRLAKYISRMAAKTSPYSTFTGWAEGHWSSDGGPAIRGSAGLSRRSVVELNAFTLQQMRRAIAGWPELRPHLRLRVNSSLLEDGEVLRFLGRRRQEAVLEVASTPTLQRFLKQIRHGDDRSYSGVVRALAAAGAQERGAEIAGFLDKLIDIGLVEIDFDIPDSALDPLGDLVRALEAHGGPRVETLRACLSNLRADLDAYVRLDAPAARFEQARTIRRDLEEIYQQLGWDPTGEQFPKNAFYEDSLVEAPELRCSSEAWSEVLGELNLLQRLAGLYDRFLPSRLVAAAFFADHYGPGTSRPFLDFYKDFCQEIRRSPGWREGYRVSGKDLFQCFEEPFPVPRVGLERLDAVAELQRRLVRHVAAQPVDAAGTRRLDPAALAGFVSALPDYVWPIASMAFYCQATVRDGAPRVVLNEVTSGFGRSRARPLRLDLLGGGDCFDHARAPGGGAHDDWYAEVAGATESNLNLRLPTTPYEIEYPGSVSGRPADERLLLSDLRVVHDADADCLHLVSQRLGTAITPVHLGAMAEFLLPPAYRFLIQLFGQAVPRFEFIKELATASALEEAEGVRRYPRLCLGNVVVNRAAWTVRSQEVPVPKKGQSTLDYLLAVQRWRRKHRIPPRCFVRAFAGDRAGSHRVALAGLLDKSRKPLYIDFASAYFLPVFEQIAREPDRLLVIEEMLPDYDDLVLRDGGGEHAYASEFVFELTDRGEKHASPGVGQRPHLLSR